MKSNILVLACLFACSSFVNTNVSSKANRVHTEVVHSLNVIADFAVLRMSGGRVYIKWRTESESSKVVFEVMRKEKGSWFMSLGEVEPKASAGDVLEYSFIDKNEFTDSTYYCIRKKNEEGVLFYSLPKAIEGIGGHR